MAKRIKQKKTNCKRIVIYGPESTGKTTLAHDLANHYETKCVPEYAREYLQKKWDLHKGKCNLNDLINIALGQINLENKIVSVSYDYYLLTNIDVPWVKDDLRDRPDNRDEMFSYFKNELDINEIKYSVVSGDKKERLKRANLILDKIFD